MSGFITSKGVQAQSKVEIRDVVFKNIRGTSSSEVAVKLHCSRARPCRNVKLIDINLPYRGLRGKSRAVCVNALGSSSGTQIPSGCL